MSGSTYDVEELKGALSRVLGTALPSLQGDSQVTDTKTTNPIAVDSEPKRSAMQQALLDQQHTEDIADIAVKQRVQTREQAGGEQESMSDKEKEELRLLNIARDSEMGKK